MANGLVPNIGAQFARGAQVVGGLQQQQLLREQAAAQAAQQAQLQGLLGRISPAQQAGAPQLAAGVQGPADPLRQGQAQAAPTADSTQALAQLAVVSPERFEAVNRGLGLITQQQKDQAADFAFKLSATPFGQREGLIEDRVRTLRAEGRNPSDTASLLGQSEQEQNQALNVVQVAALSPEKRAEIARGASLTGAQREFAGLTEGLTPEQKKEATLIELGLAPRAVGSAIQTISDEGIADQIGDAQATIKEREKFGELTGASRSKSIDAGFERIGKIDQNINNLDRAIEAVEAGAGTGAIQRRFPSIKAAAVELDQIQGELALDVIGAVTFGALSEGELNLAKQIALPSGLDGPALIQHLRDRKVAQQKLRGYFSEQIDFLDQGGSVAGFLRERERQSESGVTQPSAQPVDAQTQQRNISVDF